MNFIEKLQNDISFIKDKMNKINSEEDKVKKVSYIFSIIERVNELKGNIDILNFTLHGIGEFDKIKKQYDGIKSDIWILESDIINLAGK